MTDPFELTDEEFDALDPDEQQLYLELLQNEVNRWRLFPKQQEACDRSALVDELLFGGAAGPGKGLALDTPLPTPFGWTTMGELEVGDLLIDERGNPCAVTFATGVQHRPCYEVEFDDGSTLVADDVHRWWTYTYSERLAARRRTPEFRSKRRAKREGRGTGAKPWLAERNAARAAEAADLLGVPVGGVRSTTELVETFRTNQGKRNHCVPLAFPFAGIEKCPKIDPYVLGVWLGDGKSSGAMIYCHEGDAEILDEVERRGHEVTTYAQDITYGISNLHTQLRVSGLLNNKHVPDAYMRAPLEVRLDLIRGLMDTDGTANREDGTVEFVSTRKCLAEALFELVCSIGRKPTITEFRTKLEGRDCGPGWRVRWTPQDGDVVFYLKRKQELTEGRTRRFLLTYRTIKEIRPVESVPTRCIQVDSPSHVFLAGRSWIPTHNTETLVKHVWDLSTKFENHHSLLIRRTHPNLRRSLIRRCHQRFDAKVCTWRAADKEYRFDNGSIIEFGFCVSGSTMIRMGDGSYRPMDRVKVGDYVDTLEGPRRVTRHFHVGRKPSVRMTTPSGASVVASESHAVLSAEGLWLRPSDLSSTSTQSPHACTSREPTGVYARVLRLLASGSRSGRRPAPREWTARVGRVELRVRAVSSAGGRSGRREPRSNSRGGRPPAGWSGLVTLHEPAHRSAVFGDLWGERPRGASSGPTSSGVQGSRDGCPTAPRSDGGLPHLSPADAQERTPSLVGAGTCDLTTEIPGDLPRTPGYTPVASGWYSHPYTKVARPRFAAVRQAEVEIVPVGEQDLWDMTVEGANHYVSWGGMVHQNCDSEDDVYQYLSAEYDFIGFEEATELSGDQLAMIATRCRTTSEKRNQGINPHIWYTTNPGGPGHNYLKRRFVEPTNYGEIPVVEEPVVDELGEPLLDPKTNEPIPPRKVAFIHTTVKDNPAIDSGYLASLNALNDPVKRRMYLYGDWDVFAGQFFTEFDRQYHVVDIAPSDIPDSWPRWCAVDYGHSAPWACLWFTADPDGNILVYRSIYKAGVLTRQQARDWKALSVGERISDVYADPAVFKDGLGQSMSTAAAWGEEGMRVRRARNERVAGWARVREYLALETPPTCGTCDGDGCDTCDGLGVMRLRPTWAGSPKDPAPGIYFTSDAVELIDELIGAQYDKNKTEDLDTKLEWKIGGEKRGDHALDALRYGLMTRPPRQHHPVVEVARKALTGADLIRSRMRSKKRRGWDDTAAPADV